MIETEMSWPIQSHKHECISVIVRFAWGATWTKGNNVIRQEMAELRNKLGFWKAFHQFIGWNDWTSSHRKYQDGNRVNDLFFSATFRVIANALIAYSNTPISEYNSSIEYLHRKVLRENHWIIWSKRFANSRAVLISNPYNMPWDIGFDESWSFSVSHGCFRDPCFPIRRC